MTTAVKNAIIPGAGLDLGLGLGDQLQAQVDDELQQRKKKGNSPVMPGGSAIDLGIVIPSASGGIYGQ